MVEELEVGWVPGKQLDEVARPTALEEGHPAQLGHQGRVVGRLQQRGKRAVRGVDEVREAFELGGDGDADVLAGDVRQELRAGLAHVWEGALNREADDGGDVRAHQCVAGLLVRALPQQRHGLAECLLALRLIAHQERPEEGARVRVGGHQRFQGVDHVRRVAQARLACCRRRDAEDVPLRRLCRRRAVTGSKAAICTRGKAQLAHARLVHDHRLHARRRARLWLRDPVWRRRKQQRVTCVHPEQQRAAAAAAGAQATAKAAAA
mmetsp:Transcript_15335/g.59942  ORF Transcript_15335/g.59942 Transcript_15335/m.59942 type:complete len:264 (-) Transcript_15335:148-939(-)